MSLEPQNLLSHQLRQTNSERIAELQRKIEAIPLASTPTPKQKGWREWFKQMKPVILLIAVVASWLIAYNLLLNPQAGTSVFVLSEVETVGSSDLCPGDSLRFRVNVGVVEDGVYRLAMSTWQVGPPATIVFSEGLDMVIADSRDFPIEIEWVVPDTYKSLATSEVTSWPPGEFSRDIAVTATGRNTSTSTRKVPFTIRADCPE